MIKKLQKKFIFINMTLIGLVMIIVFAAICFFSYQWTARDSYRAMEKVIEREGMPPPLLEIGKKRHPDIGTMIPIFTVTIDETGNTIDSSKENVTVSDEVVSEVTKRVLERDEQNGIMLDLRLRFLVMQTPGGTKIAFADMGREMDSMTNLLLTLLLVGLGGLIAFFFISLFLSGWALRPAEKAWEQQRQFVADASHELKTPLTVILANTGILLSHRQDTIEEQSKWIEHTRAEANRMKKLVDDLLFLAKSDASQTHALQARLNFSDSVWRCLLPFEPVAYEQGITVSSDIDPDIMLVGDEGQLKQLILILLDNACKYAGKSGTVTLKLQRVQESVRLSVNNTGAPIIPEHLEHIFERFYRSDSSRSREEGGYGLGLAIAKAIVENHRGNISVESSEQFGTTFTVCFPSKAASEKA
ncbi:sensor protein DltS [Peptoclostridium acidaminophilum DSM 3953]|uniref:histidine kinase n=1 Tax=Peptoclostridium acidaminophilum DSM 3953 TaxID=1286171 RepID=W8U549_PEPAC|nr:HAMP domain-containing sensor histidine kinase [Peptoclostridium acidaminophilum]AHM56081.1 sensor protein DltS [Peptoclostridium acidaminophilum DSM 3953]